MDRGVIFFILLVVIILLILLLIVALGDNDQATATSNMQLLIAQFA